MAREVHEYLVTVPAGTPASAPLVQATTLPVRVVRSIAWRFPAGCGGLVGFYISMGKVQVHPLPAGTFVVGDNTSGSWTLEDQPDSGAWQVTAYNTGAFPHTLQIRYACDLVERDQQRGEVLPDLALSNYTTQLGDWWGG